MKELFKKYIDNKCSPEEVKRLLKEFDAGNNEDFLKSLIRQQLETEQDSNLTVEDGVLVKIYSNMKEEISAGKKQGKIISFYKKSWFRIAAAAVLILAVTGTYLLLNKTNDQQQIAGKEQNENDIAPGGNKAVLTLGNGSTIILDSAANGMLTQQGNTKVLKLENGQLAYNALNEEPREILYNTITTPRGGQYQLTLSDGSKVWLNAASSLRFPASFVGKERKIELTGEGYFEVAKNASMPFKVDVAGKGEVEVLGTHFNINAYTDEATINTTLLEGSVKVTGITTHDSRLITPGQQAQLNSNQQIIINKDPNIEQVMAWKNGIFNFDNANLQTVLRQLVRWYDVEIIYEGEIPQREFAGEMQRDLNLSQVLRILEKNDVHFKIEGKKLIVRK